MSTKNYFQEFDLNPMVNGGPAVINNPLDPRAHHDFCFQSDSQEVVLVPQQTAGTPIRVLVSFACGHQSLIGPNPVPPPPPGSLQFPVDGLLIMDPLFPVNADLRRKRWDCCHYRDFVKVWIDPMGPQPQPGQPVIVHVWASAKGCADKPACC